jgi:hypothetical protein
MPSNSNDARQQTTMPEPASILERRSSHEEVILEPASGAPSKTEIIGRSMKNTHYLLGVSKPYNQVTYIVHRDGRREVNNCRSHSLSGVQAAV